MTDKQIMIDGVKYNPCNDCELWNGHHCIGARSYEPNANEHKAICNEHMAKQFYKVYQQLYRKTQECEELKKQLMQKSEVDMFFNTPIEGWSSDPCGICKFKNCLTEIKEIAEENIRIADLEGLNGVYRRGLAKQILQKISEVE